MELPAGWVSTQLAEVCHIEMGQSPPTSTYNTDGHGLPFLQGKGEFGELHPTPAKYCSHPKKVASTGAILLSIRAPVGPTNIALNKCCIGRGLAAISPLGGISNRFLLWYLRYHEPALAKSGTGSTFTAITKIQVASIPIELPPLNEQRRIVEKIESLFQEIDKGVESLRATKESIVLYRQSLLSIAFEGHLTAEWRKKNPDKLESPVVLLERIHEGRELHYQQAVDNWGRAVTKWKTDGRGKRPVKPKRPPPRPSTTVSNSSESPSTNANITSNIPAFWAKTQLSEICQIEMGQSPPSNTYNTCGNGLPFLQGKSEFGETHPSPTKFCSQPKKVAKEGSILLSVRAPVGPTNITLHECCIGRGLTAILPLGDVPVKFVLQYLRFQEPALAKLGAGSTFEAISKSTVSSLPLNLPPHFEQIEIVRLLDKLFESVEMLESKLDAALTRADELRHSILKLAFSGRLVGQDSQDEPATVLLKRLRTRSATAQTRKRRGKSNAS